MEEKRKYSLKELRARYNLTQEELAKKVGLTRGMITKYEKHLFEPTMTNARAIADALGVSIDDIEW